MVTTQRCPSKGLFGGGDMLGVRIFQDDMLKTVGGNPGNPVADDARYPDAPFRIECQAVRIRSRAEFGYSFPATQRAIRRNSKTAQAPSEGFVDVQPLSGCVNRPSRYTLWRCTEHILVGSIHFRKMRCRGEKWTRGSWPSSGTKTRRTHRIMWLPHPTGRLDNAYVKVYP
jgi:hypothetical protein